MHYFSISCEFVIVSKYKVKKKVTYFIKRKSDHFTPPLKKRSWDFPGGTVVKNLPANAGDTGGLGRSHMPWSN